MRVQFKLLPEEANVDTEVLLTVDTITAPDLIEETFMAACTTATIKQDLEQPKFRRRQRNLFAITADNAIQWIQLELANG